MVATGVNGGQVALLAAQAHGHRVVASQARAEEDQEVPRVAGEARVVGRVASLVEGI